jgi:phosphoenolpyruvate carboxykinase (GTP)
MRTMRQHSIFTNCALTPEGDVWWEGMTPTPPARLTDWLRREWTPTSGRTAAHPNARFTAPAAQCPVIAAEWEHPGGVPIDAFLFGGRRAHVIPLVTEARNWNHGTFLGAIMSSEMTAAAAGTVGKLRHDPMAMLPFCGYHMGDYFAHWIRMGQRIAPDKQPRFFYVNWFRKNAANHYAWPGFGENSRVLKWIFERCNHTAAAHETPFGLAPDRAALDLTGLNINDADLDLLLTADNAGLQAEIPDLRNYLTSFGNKLPPELTAELIHLETRLQN